MFQHTYYTKVKRTKVWFPAGRPRNAQRSTRRASMLSSPREVALAHRVFCAEARVWNQIRMQLVFCDVCRTCQKTQIKSNRGQRKRVEIKHAQMLQMTKRCVSEWTSPTPNILKAKMRLMEYCTFACANEAPFSETARCTCGAAHLPPGVATRTCVPLGVVRGLFGRLPTLLINNKCW